MVSCAKKKTSRLEGRNEMKNGVRGTGPTQKSSTFQEPGQGSALCHQSMCLGGAEARGNLFIVS